MRTHSTSLALVAPLGLALAMVSCGSTSTQAPLPTKSYPADTERVVEVLDPYGTTGPTWKKEGTIVVKPLPANKRELEDPAVIVKPLR